MLSRSLLAEGLDPRETARSVQTTERGRAAISSGSESEGNVKRRVWRALTPRQQSWVRRSEKGKKWAVTLTAHVSAVEKHFGTTSLSVRPARTPTSTALPPRTCGALPKDKHIREMMTFHDKTHIPARRRYGRK